MNGDGPKKIPSPKVRYFLQIMQDYLVEMDYLNAGTAL